MRMKLNRSSQLLLVSAASLVAAGLITAQPHASRSAFLAVVDDVIDELEHIQAQQESFMATN